ncbi:ATP cone domain-containing protein [Lactovum miscens]|uniref:Transcriptional regulator NrdR family protein n=1 Tax=Lactovum miscens TaxID=190387 RepID=A0A841C9W1_9LACT|nr:transcriptional regulator NrdR family protein [Lactovum miscens]
MVKQIIKRDGRVVDYDIKKIQEAVFKAAYYGKVNGEFIGAYHVNPVKANRLANDVATLVNQDIMNVKTDKLDIEEIQNMVVKHLNVLSKFVGLAYLSYKTQKAIERG